MSHMTKTKEGRQSYFCSNILLPLYPHLSKTIRHYLRKLVLKMEGGEFYSLTIREIFRRFHGVDIGLYTYGPLDNNPALLNRGTTIGRYCSIYYTVRRFNHNHPANIKSTHPFFYEPALGMVKDDIIKRTPLVIGNDVWIGHNAIILNTVKSIGDGAVIGAGAVVYDNVPPYAIVMGQPSRVVRFRFSEPRIKELLAEKWWLKSIVELGGEIDEFRKPLEETGSVR
jgi:virginiamycin A acetyltransferase